MRQAEGRRRRARHHPAQHPKAIGDLIDIGRSEAGTTRRGQQARVAEAQGDYRRLNAKQLGQLIAKLEQEMYRHAENLEFEQAAKVRDRIHAVRESALRGDAVDVGVG